MEPIRTSIALSSSAMSQYSSVNENEMSTSSEPQVEIKPQQQQRRTLAEYMSRFGEEPNHSCYELPDLLADLKICPAWKCDDTRSIADFIDQFWNRIGQFTSNPFLCLMRFNHILDASPDTSFVADDVRQYMEERFSKGLEPKFSYAENSLLSVYYWLPKQRADIKQCFKDSVRGKPTIEDVKSWYHKLKHIEHPQRIIDTLMWRMTPKLMNWANKEYGRNYPANISELYIWIQRFYALPDDI